MRLLDALVALVPADSQAAAQGLAQALLYEIASQPKGPRAPEGQELVTVAGLQKAVTEAVQIAVKAATSATQPRSWANVAAGPTATAPGTQDLPRKVIP